MKTNVKAFLGSILLVTSAGLCLSTLWQAEVMAAGGGGSQGSAPNPSTPTANVPATTNSQVPDAVATPQPFQGEITPGGVITGSGPSQVPSSVSTPPPFEGEIPLGRGIQGATTQGGVVAGDSSTVAATSATSQPAAAAAPTPPGPPPSPDANDTQCPPCPPPGQPPPICCP